MKKRLIKIIILSIIILSVFLIYKIFKTDKLNYIAIGDSLAAGQNPYGENGYSYSDFVAEKLNSINKLTSFTKKYAENSNTTKELIKDIETTSSLKKELRESDLVTVSIGMSDFLSTIKKESLNVNELLELKTNVNQVLPNVKNAIQTIKKYAKKDIIIIGYYNPIPFLFNTSGSDLDKLFSYIDDEYQKIADDNNCKYISIYQLFKKNTDYLPNPTDIHPNLDGYKAIANKIIDSLEQSCKEFR